MTKIDQINSNVNYWSQCKLMDSDSMDPYIDIKSYNTQDDGVLQSVYST